MMTKVARPDKWLITGAAGLFGTALCRMLVERGVSVCAIIRAHRTGLAGINEIDADVTDLETFGQIVVRQSPDIIVHAAGLTNVDACEANEDGAHRIHADAAAMLANYCAIKRRKFIYISTDHLWDGKKEFRSEDEVVEPINAYARSKAAGETAALGRDGRALIVRTNFFGPGRPWRTSLSDWIIDRLVSGNSVPAFTDTFFTPIYIDHLIPILLKLVGRDAAGIFHIAGSDRLSKYEFAIGICERMGLPRDRIRKSILADAALRAARPSDMSLSTAKISQFLGHAMPTIEEGLDALCSQITSHKKTVHERYR
jgi:dTDP-4-dehydrorhamnose reductase